jgi:hypothetical protein
MKKGAIIKQRGKYYGKLSARREKFSQKNNNSDATV